MTRRRGRGRLMLLAMRPHAVLAALLLTATAAQAGEGPWVLDAGFWAAPRSGESLRSEPVVREAVDALMRDGQGSRLLIRYPGGETGQLWAQELRAWLIALGVPSARLRTEPGGVPDDQLRLAVEP